MRSISRLRQPTRLLHRCHLVLGPLFCTSCGYSIMQSSPLVFTSYLIFFLCVPMPTTHSQEVRSLRRSKISRQRRSNGFSKWMQIHSVILKFCELVAAVHSCPPSSAGVERIFIAYFLTETKLRNRLSHPHVAKLVTVRRALASRSPSDDQENEDLSLIFLIYFCKNNFYSEICQT